MYKVCTLIVDMEENVVLVHQEDNLTQIFKQDDVVKVSYRGEERTEYIRGIVHCFGMGTITIDDGTYLVILKLDKIKTMRVVKGKQL